MFKLSSAYIKVFEQDSKRYELVLKHFKTVEKVIENLCIQPEAQPENIDEPVEPKSGPNTDYDTGDESTDMEDSTDPSDIDPGIIDKT
jgi:hypothetical protein